MITDLIWFLDLIVWGAILSAFFIYAALAAMAAVIVWAVYRAIREPGAADPEPETAEDIADQIQHMQQLSALIDNAPLIQTRPGPNDNTLQRLNQIPTQRTREETEQ